jgi:hypothetical protein
MQTLQNALADKQIYEVRVEHRTDYLDDFAQLLESSSSLASFRIR